MNSLGNEGHPDIEAKLARIREETERDQLFVQSPHFAKKMEIHMDRKEGELIALNSQLNDTYNINILQKESSKSLEQVLSNRQNITGDDIVKEIDRITKKYNEKARGTNSQKLLSEFMQVFIPSIYAEAGIYEQTDKRIERLVNENAHLDEELKKLQKKKGACCFIMWVTNCFLLHFKILLYRYKKHNSIKKLKIDYIFLSLVNQFINLWSVS